MKYLALTLFLLCNHAHATSFFSILEDHELVQSPPARPVVVEAAVPEADSDQEQVLEEWTFLIMIFSYLGS